jgi:uncharacterized membrane protein YphA (DoxX/SURF4 family)
MTSLDWIAQILLAAVFLWVGFSKFIAFQRHEGAQNWPDWRGAGLGRKAAYSIAVVEIMGALGLVVPVKIWRPDFLPLLAAAVLSLLSLAAIVHQTRRKQHAAPLVALFLLTLLVIVGQLR